VGDDQIALALRGEWRSRVSEGGRWPLSGLALADTRRTKKALEAGTIWDGVDGVVFGSVACEKVSCSCLSLVR
jgi:hypothetical protein